jgi:hypothetical protein
MKKAYTASSLKRALEKIPDEGGVLIDTSDISLLMCPIDGKPPYNSKEPCFGNPTGCQRAQFQQCLRSVRVQVNDNTRFCRRLSIRFTISDTNNDGYIDKYDQTLSWLINSKKLISRDDLVPVDV